MENYFSIGEVAKYQNISKQTLIFYDKIGLFCPAYVDPKNGYRYYSAGQIDYLDTILIMKKIGFSLSDIREHMRDYTSDTSLAAMKKQLTVIESRIEELRLIRSRLLHRCVQMEEAQRSSRENSVTEEITEERSILYREVAAPYTLREISIATKQCFADFFQNNLPVYFQCGVSVPLKRIREGRYTEASIAFLPIEKTDRAENILVLPAGRCVSVCHTGNYLSIGRSYEKLLGYCKAHGLQIISDAYEFCINDYITTNDENEYITKILFYVQSEK